MKVLGDQKKNFSNFGILLCLEKWSDVVEVDIKKYPHLNSHIVL